MALAYDSANQTEQKVEKWTQTYTVSLQMIKAAPNTVKVDFFTK
jgi:hypothetical protein